MNQKSHFTLKHALTCLCLLPLTLLSLTAQTTAVPDRINYQGTLLKADGTALDNGNYTLTFRLYSAEEGGELVWGPQVFDGDTSIVGHAAQVPVVGGQFNVILGQEDTNDPTRYLAEAFNGSTRFLEITIGGELIDTPIAPRQEILSAPFAFQAENAENAVPIGTIISLHPQAPAPNPNFWQLCDGTATILGSRLAEAGMKTTPDLTDDRFLMGVEGDDKTDLKGGANTISGHSHDIAGHSHDKGDLSATTNNDTHLHRLARDQYGGGDRLTADNTPGSDEGIYPKDSTSSDTHKHTVTLSGRVGNNDQGAHDGDYKRPTSSNGSFNNRPNYFKVVYYIKIN